MLIGSLGERSLAGAALPGTSRPHASPPPLPEPLLLPASPSAGATTVRIRSACNATLEQ